MTVHNLTASELQAWLRLNYPIENERHEWKGWQDLKHHVSGRAGDDLTSYVSGLSNMEGGTIVLGVEDGSLKIVGITNVHGLTPEKLKFRLAELCINLPTQGLRVREWVTTDSGARVWLVEVPRHASRQPVLSHGKAWQRIGDSLVELRPDRHQAILAEPLAGEDWSAEVLPGAALSDLDPHALALARQKFADSSTAKPWFKDIADWSDVVFLDKARLTINGGITRTALLLLGKPECVHLLSPFVAEISWKLPEERAVEHFSPPFFLTTTEILKRIRNPNIKLFPSTRLLAEEMPKYETRVILEALHNCVAHQDYERCARIVVEEHRGHLIFRSAGGFFDGYPEQYLAGSRMPGSYRNKFLAFAMVQLKMIDTAGFGIYEMFSAQRRRFLPLPDYEQSDAQQVVLKIYGQAIDENYSQLLMERSDLPLEHVVWLDRVQKKLKVDDAQITELRKAKLIEGRKPHWTVSASVAAATDSQSEYILNRGFGDEYYKRLILERLEKFGPASGRQLKELIWGKLPNILSTDAKEAKVKNLRTSLRIRGLDGKRIEIDPSGPARGPSAIWRLRQGSNVV